MDDQPPRRIDVYGRPPPENGGVGRCVECWRDLRGREHFRIELADGAGADAGHLGRACSWQCLALFAWTRHVGD